MNRAGRESTRKPGHDYASPGMYVVTICTRNRECLLGEIHDDRMQVSGYGDIVEQEWRRIPERFPSVRLDEYVIMPNHLHGIIVLTAPAVPESGDATDAHADAARDERVPGGGDATDADATDVERAAEFVDATDADATQDFRATGWAGASPAPTVSAVIGAFKSLADRACREAFIARYPDRRFGRLWQRNFYDHIVVNPRDVDRIRRYIRENVANWATDKHRIHR